MLRGRDAERHRHSLGRFWFSLQFQPSLIVGFIAFVKVSFLSGRDHVIPTVGGTLESALLPNIARDDVIDIGFGPCQLLVGVLVNQAVPLKYGLV